MKEDLKHKLETLKNRLKNLESVIVGFSGGVDSTVLLRIAVDTLGSENVLAITARSPSMPMHEMDSVEQLASDINAPHEFFETSEFDDENYRSNPTNRCYYCKLEIFGNLIQLAQERGYNAVLDGTNADDLGDFRPGLEAATELNVQRPMADSGLTKADLRSLAAEFGLPVYNKPSSPCLASRVQYGEALTPEKMRRIDEAETFLRDNGFRECRVRHHNDLARIEVPPSEIERFADPALRLAVDEKFRELGYQYVSLDLRGFRSGSMNEVHLAEGLKNIPG